MWTWPSMNSGGVAGCCADALRMPREAASAPAPSTIARRVTDDFAMLSSEARSILRHDPVRASHRGVAVRHATSRLLRQRTGRTLDDPAAHAVAAGADPGGARRGQWCLDLVRDVRQRPAGRAAAWRVGQLQLLGPPGAGAGAEAPGDRDRQPR